VTSTHSFNQFAYRQDDSTANGDEGAQEGDFDSLWKSL